MEDEQHRMLPSLMELEKQRQRAVVSGTLSRQGNLDVLTLEEEEDEEGTNNNKGNQIGICNLVALFPFTTPDGKPFTAIAMHDQIAQMVVAAHHLNTADGSIIPEVESVKDICPQLKFSILPSVDTSLDERIAVEGVIELTDYTRRGEKYGNSSALPCAIVGALRSAVSKPTSIITGLRGYPQVSLGSTADDLDDRSLYPLFGRLTPSERGSALSYIVLLRDVLKIRYLAVVYVDDEFGNSFSTGLRWAIENYRTSNPDNDPPYIVLQTVQIPPRAEDLTPQVLERAVRVLKETRFTYFVACVYDSQINAILLEAHLQGIAGTGKHSWFLPLGYSVIPGSVVKRGSALDKVYQGAFTIGPKVVGYENTEGEHDDQSDAFKRLIEVIRHLRDNTPDIDYVRSLLPEAVQPVLDKQNFFGARSPALLSAYDASIALGLAACRAIQQQQQQQPSSEGISFYLGGENHFREFLQTDFNGTTGRVVFDNITGTRLPDSYSYSIGNYVADPVFSNDTHVVYQEVHSGTFENGVWNIFKPLIFNDGTRNVPSDIPELELEDCLHQPWSCAAWLFCKQYSLLLGPIGIAHPLLCAIHSLFSFIFCVLGVL